MSVDALSCDLSSLFQGVKITGAIGISEHTELARQLPCFVYSFNASWVLEHFVILRTGALLGNMLGAGMGASSSYLGGPSYA
jgi:hypothetical protein